MQKEYETDWLASVPVFYNERNRKASYNINDIIDYRNLEFDPEGFNNYLDFGYSVFGQSPIKDVKVLRFSSKLIMDEEQKISIEYLQDPAENCIDQISDERDVLQQLYSSVNEWAHSVTGEIVIPLSGGYDSRLLCCLLNDKERIRAFTYGISEKQTDSFEVVKAKKIAELLGVNWEQIFLGQFHKYLTDWDLIFGPSTHSHGMYHMEFYNKILPEIQGNNPFISGIIGDAWAGNVHIDEIRTVEDLYKLRYSHGMNADSSQSLLRSDKELMMNFFEKEQKKLKSSRYRIITSMRFKMILLSYLLRIPKLYGFRVWSPFLNPDIAFSMLNLPSERRNGRAWQKDFFEKRGLGIENMKLIYDKKNTLNLQALYNCKLKPLNVNLLREVVNPSYIEWINRNINYSNYTRYYQMLNDYLLSIPKFGGVMRRMGFAEKYNLGNTQIKAYYAYLTLKPIENVIIKRNNA